MMRKLGVILCLMPFLGIAAQADRKSDAPQIIDADNFLLLRSVATIDFQRYAHDAGPFVTGWFAVNDGGTWYAGVNQANQIVMWSLDGQPGDVVGLYDANERARFIDATFAPDSDELIGVFQAGQQYMIHAAHPGRPGRTLTIASPNTPLSIWADANHIWLEVAPVDPQAEVFILRIPFSTLSNATEQETLSEADFTALPYAPSADLDAFVRIGRIPPPFAVTSSPDGIVKRWDLETGKVTAEAQAADEPVVFGQINASGSHLAWRDGDSRRLHLLEFESGADQPIDELHEQYVQWFFLTAQADVILAVNIGFDPVVIAWDTRSGERHNLGRYRKCDRVPDMARLSRDGTTLVIGCNTGLDIWRVYEAK